MEGVGGLHDTPDAFFSLDWMHPSVRGRQSPTSRPASVAAKAATARAHPVIDVESRAAIGSRRRGRRHSGALPGIGLRTPPTTSAQCRVRTIGSPRVTINVCSYCAERLPRTPTSVHPSDASVTTRLLVERKGSMVITRPSVSTRRSAGS